MSDENEKYVSADESVDDLNAQIIELQKKMAAKQLAEMKREAAQFAIEVPTADITVKLDKNGSDQDVDGVTPAEVLVITSIHHAAVGGNPIVGFRRTGGPKKKVDPRDLRDYLRMKYGVKRVDKLFPGSEPQLPISFARAMQIGLETKDTGRKLVDFEVQPLGTHEGD